jgi:signal transduction histidine kinase
MATIESKILAVEQIQRIPMVPTMLEVICQSTGMGFAAIARVTGDSWVACSVRDEIDFGLKAGGELKIETTICNMIRENRQPVVINHVSESVQYANHHTPKMYGFESYISVPIILRNGEMFGTLCAIDPRPAELENSRTLGMFGLFAELIAFHLQAVDKLEENSNSIRNLSEQLNYTKDENRQYQHISNHNLQEPLRKLRVFSNLMISAVDKEDKEKVKNFAQKINSNAQRFSMMIKDLSEFNYLNDMKGESEVIDLDEIVSDVTRHLQQQLYSQNARVNNAGLPKIMGSRIQLEQLFFHLISNSLKFASDNRDTAISIEVVAPSAGDDSNLFTADTAPQKIHIKYQDNGIGIDNMHLEKVFDIFSQLEFDQDMKSGGIGLAYCRKIIRNHGGTITATSEPGKGTTFNIHLPAL